MRNNLLAIAAIAGLIGAPVAAQAQSEMTTGMARGAPVVGAPVVGAPVVGAPVVVDPDVEAIDVDQLPAFREYIVRERVPNYAIPERAIVGNVLPETGVTIYDVPQTFGVTPYRYTVVNGRTVLVEPRTRRIVQVVE
jgi:hypothetical protein